MAKGVIMNDKLRKKFFIIITIAAFITSLLSLSLYILRSTQSPKYDTFKIFPVKSSSEDKIKISERVIQCNKRSTRIKFFLGSNRCLNEGGITLYSSNHNFEKNA